jgi:hypothetical protein
MTASAYIQAFQVSPYSMGVDRKRSVIKTDPGYYVAEPGETIRSGMVVSLNSSQRVIKSVGTHVLGIALYNQTSTEYAMVVGEYIQLNGTTATNLAHANLWNPTGAGGGVRVAAALTGAAYTETVDYTISYTNGTVTRAAMGGIADGAYVYVNYLYALTSADLDFEGRNFWNLQDDVAIQDGKITVCQDQATIFTACYDASKTYAVNDKLYAGATADSLDGYVTTDNTGDYIGRVLQVPTASDPFLGFRFTGIAVA